MRGISDAEVSSSTAATTSSSSSSGSFAILQNYPLISAFVAFAIAQLIKFFTTWYKEKRWDAKQLIGSGGMPSSHSATVTALAVAIGFHEGFSGSIFATAMIFACVVMYDAFGVRLHAGRQAEVLNQIVYELPAEHPLADTRPLRELLGHTPTQVVAGAILGLATASIAHLISKL
ncbi:uncharacterized protein A4U43_C04F5170 [Asparagus officinalis]|uniref:Phosphatidic acid phosphatase type 2/haloperoxidase domain-containing protein n=1 Tax=Asparagus officinalis TaxID=4686 RepID=A0A5P1EYH1_ASPOF|nr:uncharacterized protein LOC109836665 [Asparagus officinalis]ONK71145.1 uncharacterized protein A4U43_C04F5170 [Asparagus officinalis]